MDHKDIQVLLLKYREGRSTDEEAGQIHRWYDSLNAESRLSLDHEERNALESRMLNNIWEGINESDNRESERSSSFKWWKSTPFYSAVAAAIVISIIGLLYFNKSVSPDLSWREAVLIHPKSELLITVENTTDSEKRVELEDKSVVLLSPGSKMIYPQKFERHSRAVQLIGDAFFEITKNPTQPFYVYSDRLITRVLGTSFRIKTKRNDGAMEVEVVTGKVSVFENEEVVGGEERLGGPNSGVVLTPNQKVIYFLESGHLLTSLVEKPIPVTKIEESPKMIFNNSELSLILLQLQNDYGIEIVVDNDRLDNCTFTGDLSDMTLFDKLDLICKSNGAEYDVKGTRILISGKGCEK